MKCDSNISETIIDNDTQLTKVETENAFIGRRVSLAGYKGNLILGDDCIPGK